jgi:hypothetical protein
VRSYLKHVRKILWAALAVSSAFAAWTWFRPYEWNSDSAARCEIVGTQVTRDRSNFWVEPHLKVLAGSTHDLEKPVFLITASGKKLEPADTTLAGDGGKGTSEIWFKFWLESDEIAGPLTLQINEGKLSIKSNAGIPEITGTDPRYFISNHW